jgi:hypothetical protein
MAPQLAPCKAAAGGEVPIVSVCYLVLYHLMKYCSSSFHLTQFCVHIRTTNFGGIIFSIAQITKRYL